MMPRRLRCVPALLAWLVAGLVLMGCGTPGPKPRALVDIQQPAPVNALWHNSRYARVSFPMQLGVSGSHLALAINDSTVAALDRSLGQEVWRVQMGSRPGDRIASGIGFDGEQAAVTTLGGELVLIEVAKDASSDKAQARVLWRAPLPSRSFTPPLIAGGRVFVLLADRTVLAYDGKRGQRLWKLNPATTDPIVLSESGTLGVYKNTLLVGGLGRLAGVNPDNGQLLWELPVAASRATNDVERLTDLVGGLSRNGDSVCTRAYQTGIACLDLRQGTNRWTQRSSGYVAVGGDAEGIASVEFDSTVRWLDRASGSTRWSNLQLMYRSLSAPLVMGNWVVVGDAQGYVHLLSKADGTLRARFGTDGSAITTPPVAVGETVVVVTGRGGVFAFTPNSN